MRMGEREWQLVRGEPVTPMPYDDNVSFLLFEGDRAVATVELEGRGQVWIASERVRRWPGGRRTRRHGDGAAPAAR